MAITYASVLIIMRITEVTCSILFMRITEVSILCMRITVVSILSE